MDGDDVDGAMKGRQKMTRSVSYFHNVQNSLLVQTRKLTAYLTSDDKNTTKALQQAAYTTISTFFLILCLAVAICIYFILEPFLRPLLWALLCGTLLHPFKHVVTERFQLRLDSLTRNDIPLLIGIFISPVVYLNELSGFLEAQFFIYWKEVIGLSMLCILLYSAMPYYSVLTSWLMYCGGVLNSIIDYVDPWLSYVTPLHIFTIIICCVLVNYVGPARTRLVKVMSSIAWGLAIVLLVSTIFGSIRIYVLIIIGCVVVTLSLSDTCRHKVSSSTKGESDMYHTSESPEPDETDSFSEDIADTNVPFSSTPSKQTIIQTLHPVEISSPPDAVMQSDVIRGRNAEVTHMESVECKASGDVRTAITTKHSSGLLDDSHAIHHTTNNHQNNDDVRSHDHRGSHDQISSHDDIDFGYRKLRKTSFRNYKNKKQAIFRIFFILILICIVTAFYHNPWVACSLLLPVACTVLIRRIVLISLVNAHLKRVWSSWKSSSLYNVIFPPPVCHVYNAYTKLDKKIVEMLRNYSNSLISAVIVIGLVLATIAFSILLLLQVQSDITHYSTVSAQMWDKVRTSYPSLDKLENVYDHVASRGYQYGCHWLISQVKSITHIGNINDTTVDELIQTLDHLCKTYVLHNTTAQPKPSNLFNNDSNQLMSNQLMKSARGFFMKNYQSIMKMSGSVWTLMSTQLNFAISMTTAIISLLFHGGTVVLNFIVSVIVFVSTLYYLLNASGVEYLPVTWISNILPTGDDPDAGATAFTMAIRSVFAASLKTAAFYGLYTWLIHAIFGMQTAVLAAALAAVAGAIPFIGTYWASLPAVLELLLVHDQPLLAVIFFCLHILPTMFVDYLIYEDLESGHPYLTGLAIVGGFYYAGLEGAILGPILLCCLLFFQHLYEHIMVTN